ncbi:hypothetical protein LCGC14_0484030 [marine sediment metagenome]|uniref:Uncharacterized protein n=1 Tax=marine sediment metagenome TaxID=412755 RepID=A0A0F9SRW4_9ZZZZ
MSQAFRIPELLLSPQELDKLRAGTFSPTPGNILGLMGPQTQLPPKPGLSKEGNAAVSRQIADALRSGVSSLTKATLSSGIPDAVEQGIRIFSERVSESGFPSAFAQGFNEIPLALGSLPGVPQATRLGIRALAGERGVQRLFPDQEEPATAPTITTAQALDKQAPQQAPQQTQPSRPGFQPVQVPDLPALQRGVPPDFSAAREALGSPPPAQEIKQSERLSRTLGGLAAGGLEAVRGAPAGRAATLGEILAGIGAGGARASAQLGQENRTLELLAQQSSQQHQKQISAIALAEEAAKAENSTEEARAFNQRAVQEIQMGFQADLANAQMKQLQPLGNGAFYDPISGEFGQTRTETAREVLQGLILMDQVSKSQFELTGTALGKQVLFGNLSPGKRPYIAAAIQAINTRTLLPSILELLAANGEKDLAGRVKQLSQGIPGTSDEQDQVVASNAIAAIADMMLVDHTSGSAPLIPWVVPMIQQAMSVYGFNPPGAQ